MAFRPDRAKHKNSSTSSDMLSFKKKNAGQRATTSSQQHFACASHYIFAAMHKEKLKFKVMLRVTVLYSVKRNINLLKNGGYFRLTPSNDLNTVPPLTSYNKGKSHVIVFFSVFFFHYFFFTGRL